MHVKSQITTENTAIATDACAQMDVIAHSCALFAHGYPLCSCACFAGHITTPVELALTSLIAGHPQSIVPTAATQGITIVYSCGSGITNSTLSSR